MKQKWVMNLAAHLIAVIVFLSVALIYCRPAFDNKVLVQEDVTQWKAMAQNSFRYKEQHGHFPLWTNGMFSGMPAYLIAMDVDAFQPQNFFYDLFTLHLKKPANFFFLACVCFYFLTQVLRVNPFIGIIGGLAYAYATYNPVIIGVGHDTKMQAIALLPAFIGSLLMLYEKKYAWGAALTALFTSIFIAVNHLQIFYYGLIIATAMTIGYTIRWVRQKEFRRLLVTGALAAFCGLIGVLSNAALIFTTAEFSKATIRGGSELAESGSMIAKGGLGEDYAFSYSMYRSEPFVLLAPKIFGGSSGPELSGGNSKAAAALQTMPPQLAQQVQGLLSFYWGGIGGTAGPSYAGAIICCLALMGLFILDNKHKWWITATCILSIMMSWGGYFPAFNGVLLKFLPAYNKFRAPSVIMVIPVFLFCMLAVLTLQKIWTDARKGVAGGGLPADGLPDDGSPGDKDPVDAQARLALWKNYKKGLSLVAGVFAVLLLLYFSFDYTTTEERQFLRQTNAAGAEVTKYVQSFLKGLREDRQGLFLHSWERSLLFVAAVLLLTGLYIKGKVRSWLFAGLTGLLAFVDIMGIDLQYLNGDNYKKLAEAPAIPTPSAADKQVLQDTGYYRVLDIRSGLATALTYGAPVAWWHHSIGGYNAAKLSIYQDLIDHQLENFPRCMPVIDMLNTKYIIQQGAQSGDTVVANPAALGAVWFVREVRFERDARSVMNALTSFDPKDTAILFDKDRGALGSDWRPDSSDRRPDNSDSRPGSSDPLRPGLAVLPRPDSGASIRLIRHENDLLEYQSESKAPQFAVFSEVFYDRGWKAYLDGDAESLAGRGATEKDAVPGGSKAAGMELPIIRTNYVLRGVSVPAGRHTIRMVFHPTSYYAGLRVQNIAGVLLVLLLAGAVLMEFWGRNQLK